MRGVMWPGVFNCLVGVASVTVVFLVTVGNIEKPRVPMGSCSDMRSCSFVVGVEWKVRVLSVLSVGVEKVGRNSSVIGDGVCAGRSRRWTSARGKGFNPRPGTRTRVAPLFPSVVPTATPVSEEGEKC